MVIEIVFNNKIQIYIFSNLYIYLIKKKLRGKSLFVFIIGKILILSIRQNLVMKYQRSKMMFSIMF
jgi:hypothetical protein